MFGDDDDASWDSGCNKPTNAVERLINDLEVMGFPREKIKQAIESTYGCKFNLIYCTCSRHFLFEKH